MAGKLAVGGYATRARMVRISSMMDTVEGNKSTVREFSMPLGMPVSERTLISDISQSPWKMSFARSSKVA